VAIDPAAGKIYWTDVASARIRVGNLDGSGSPATLFTDPGSFPGFLALLRAPAAAGAPTVTGGSSFGSQLSCSQAQWAADLLGASLYRAPRSFTYQWSRDGTAIASATSPSYTASSPGQYTCTVSAQNQAGSTQQTSAPHTVSSPMITISKHGTGSGTVTSAPSGIDCGLTCTASFAPETAVMLTATPTTGSVFAGWSGACAGANACDVTMSQDQAVTAVFNLLRPNTKLTKNTISAHRHRATFKFKAIGIATGFQCALVKRPKPHHKKRKPSFRSCRSPKTYTHLKPGGYIFFVRAFNAAGADPTPAQKTFTIQ
jgi:hypothetical protein